MKKSVDGIAVEMTAIVARNLWYIGYNQEKKVLMIEFRRGPVYVFNEVPESVYEELLKSDAPDEFFDEKIKNGFKNRRVW